MEQSVVLEHQTCPSTNPEIPEWHLVPFHCEGCGHVFPVTPLFGVGRTGCCRARSLPGYGPVHSH